MSSLEEKLSGSEVPSREWCREWLPDVGKLHRGGVGEEKAAVPDALNRAGVYVVLQEKSHLGKGLPLQNPPLSSHSLGCRVRADGEGLGRVGCRQEAASFPALS